VISTPYRRLYRRADGRVLGGVAAGLADHLGVPLVAVRLGFVGLSGFAGFGVVLYAAFWAVLQRDPDRRDSDRDTGQFVVFGALALGGLLLAWLVTGGGQLGTVWPAVIVILGAGVIWHRADPEQRRRWVDYHPKLPWAAVLLGEGGRGQAAFRLVAGGVLVGVGLIGFLVRSGELGAARDGLLFGGVLLTGVAVVAGPWIWRTVTELRAERAERIRSQTRADIAAVVHDQVLHTLALIQRKADDPREVARLARGQERDLRNWLYKPTASPTETLSAALEAAAAEVEDTYAVTVDVVVVGDGDTDERLEALVQATREALVNAGKHAGVPTVSLYAEVEPDEVSVFVRDRGAGFDLGAVDGDRHGVAGSIVGRMERHGGTAEIRTAPGAGTEVRLRIGRTRNTAGTARGAS
jgi:phage shock protein PspC (stress-responsive transcriptional regulator)/anti-sigma regulatory factor (Ser/Thr protein kinase)